LLLGCVQALSTSSEDTGDFDAVALLLWTYYQQPVYDCLATTSSAPLLLAGGSVSRTMEMPRGTFCLIRFENTTSAMQLYTITNSPATTTDTDMAMKVGSTFGSASWGTLGCAGAGWSVCNSLSTGVTESIGATGLAVGARMSLGVYAFSCPSAGCRFTLSITQQ